MSVYFIRHGQSEFNAVYNREVDPMIFDAPLTKLGRQQALKIRQSVRTLGIKRVVASPLTRAIQTAKLIFDGLAPISVEAGHHEYLLSSCDVGRPPHALKSTFPDLDFDHLPQIWWHNKTGDLREISVEPIPDFEKRIEDFVAGIEKINDVPVAFVGHGNAFQHIIGRMLDNCEIHQYR